MWAYAPGANIHTVWLDLNQIRSFGTRYDDFDAADACLDGMRDILQNWRNELGDPFALLEFTDLEFEEPCGRLIVDYMVHRSCDIKQWIDASEKWECYMGPGSLEEALSEKFSEEAQSKEDGIGEPDLMVRCRYHLHVEKGLPCYLDK